MEDVSRSVCSVTEQIMMVLAIVANACWALTYTQMGGVALVRTCSDSPVLHFYGSLYSYVFLFYLTIRGLEISGTNTPV